MPDWRFRVVSPWARLLQAADLPGDVDLVAGRWDRIAELHPAIDIEPDSLPEADPAAARALYELIEALRAALSRGVVPQPSSGVESLLSRAVRWDEAEARAARPAVLAWGELLPDAVARTLTAWGETAE